MAELTFQCPFCGKEFIAESEWSGMEVSCPHCQRHVMIDIPRPVPRAHPVPRVCPPIRPQTQPIQPEPPQEDHPEDYLDDSAADDFLIPIYRLISMGCFIFAIADMLTPFHECNMTGAYASPGYFMIIGVIFAALGQMMPTNGENE